MVGGSAFNHFLVTEFLLAAKSLSLLVSVWGSFNGVTRWTVTFLLPVNIYQFKSLAGAEIPRRRNLPTFLPPLASDWPPPPLLSRMKDSFIQNNTWEGPLVCRPAEEGGCGLMDVFPAGPWREKGGRGLGGGGPSVRLCPAAFNIWSPAVSLGGWSIDLIWYQKEIKSCWEIAFCGARRLATGAARLAFCQQITL